ncbi:hypothetical protein GCK32_017533, partial [Trichostrongylus colubriformis]
APLTPVAPFFQVCIAVEIQTRAVARIAARTWIELKTVWKEGIVARTWIELEIVCEEGSVAFVRRVWLKTHRRRGLPYYPQSLLLSGTYLLLLSFLTLLFICRMLYNATVFVMVNVSSSQKFEKRKE